MLDEVSCTYAQKKAESVKCEGFCKSGHILLTRQSAFVTKVSVPANC